MDTNNFSINDAIKREYDELSKEYTVYGVFLYGSQNYGLSTPESDIDTKAIIVPSFSDLVHRPPVSKVRTFEWGECDVKDIREMMSSYRKQNVNFIETLFTEYSFIGPEYEDLHKELIGRREEIAHFDEKKALDCFNGLMMQSKKRLYKCTDKTWKDISEYGYHRKSLMNIYKFRAMVEKYINGEPYSRVLDNAECIKYRTAVVPEVESIMSGLDKEVSELIKGYTPKPKNEELGEWLDEWIESVISRNLR